MCLGHRDGDMCRARLFSVFPQTVPADFQGKKETERNTLISSKSVSLPREQLLSLRKTILFKPRDHVVATSYLPDWKVTLRSYHLSCRRTD